MATMSLCIFGLLFFALVKPHPDSVWLLVFVAATVACSILFYLLFIKSFSRTTSQLSVFLNKVSPKKWTKLSQAFQRSRHMDNKVLVNSFVLSIVAHLAGVISFWLIAQSLGMALPLLTIGWIRSGMILATMLPITIAGIGVREVAALALLQLYGVETDDAIAFSFLVFATTVVGIGILGGIAETWRYVYSRKAS